MSSLSQVELAPATSIAPTQERWYAVQTRARHEKMVAAKLDKFNVATYLPIVTEVHHWSDRRKTVQLPLFPGYVFIHVPNLDEARTVLFRLEGFVGIVGNGQGISIPDEQIESVRTLLTKNARYQNHPFLKLGQRVRIRGGALDGVEGILLERRGETSLVVSIDLIQRSLAVRIDGYDVEAI